MNTKQDLITALENRSRELLQQLQTFQEIETEYRQTVKALNALQGERLNQARPTPEPGLSLTSREAPAVYGNLQQLCLNLVAQNPKGMSVDEIWEASKTAKRDTTYQCMRRLFRTHAVAEHNGAYTITKRGLEKIDRLAVSSAASLALSPTPSVPATRNGNMNISTTNALRVLAEYPEGTRVTGIANRMGIEGRRDHNRLSVIMPYLRSTGKATSSRTDDGVIYKITAKGKAEVANSLAQHA